MRKIYLFVGLLFLSLGLLVSNITVSAQWINPTIFECFSYNYFDVILDEDEEYNVKTSVEFIVETGIYCQFRRLGTSILFTDYNDRYNDVEYYLTFLVDYDSENESLDVSAFFALDSDYNNEICDYENKYIIYSGTYDIKTSTLNTITHRENGVYIPDYTNKENDYFICEGQTDRYFYSECGERLLEVGIDQSNDELEDFYTENDYYLILSCIYCRNYKPCDSLDENDYYYLVNIDNLVTTDEIISNITVTDLTYGDITGSLRILYTEYEELDTEAIGDYVLILGASDIVANASYLKIIVKVCDIVSPTITKLENSIDVGMYNDEITSDEILTYVEIIDNDQVTNIEVDLSNYEENKTSIGTYSVSVTAYDADENFTTATIDVNVVDNVAPTITANTTSGQFSRTISTQDTLTLDMLYSFVTVTDNYDENPSISLTGYENIDFDKLIPANIILTYTATDSAGNSTTKNFYLYIEDLDYPTFVVSDEIIELESGLTLTHDEIIDILSNYTDSAKTIATVASSYFDDEYPTESYKFTVMYTDDTIEVFTISFTGSDNTVYGNNTVSSTNNNSWLMVVASICGIILLASGIFIYKRLKKNR